MVDIAVGNNPNAAQGIMTWLTCDSAKMDLYQTVKLKRQLVDSRTSPDSAGDDYKKGRNLDSRHGTVAPDPRVYDGGGNEYVSSSPMEIETSRDMSSHQLSPVEEMSTTSLPPDTSDRKVDIQSTIHIAPIFASNDEGCSLGAGGTGGGDLMASVGNVPPSGSRTPNSSTNIFWGNRYNGAREAFRTMSLQPTFADTMKNNSHERQRAPKVIMGESGGVKTMMWTTSLPPSPQPPFNTQGPPREVLHSPVSSHFGPDTSEAILASVDGLLSLGQDRRVSSPTHNPIVRVTSSGELFPLSSSSSSSYSHYSPHDSPRNPQNPPLNMERLWAGERTQLCHSQVDSQAALNLSKVGIWGEHMQGLGTVDSSGVIMTKDDDDDDQPMICMICDDKATGLHYGIITCEGCKGFFKRTVQNKRVYTCVADGECEITKAQRNRCQFCRFNKCINQGMVLEAVREDRMPGGRNSGAVYNKYKIKYKKKKCKNGQIKQGPLSPPKGKITGYETVLEGIMGNSLGASPNPSSSPIPMQVPTSHMSPHSASLISGNILKTALTKPLDPSSHFRHRGNNNIMTCSSSSESIQSNSIEVAHLRRRLDINNSTCSSLDSGCSSSSESGLSPISASNMIKALIDCDDFENLATLRSIEDLLDHKNDFATKLCELGDSIGMKLVSWTKKLPFYKELSVELHAHLLTSKWHEILVLASSAYQAIYGVSKINSVVDEGDDNDFRAEMSNNLCTIQNCLTTMMGRHYGIDSIRQDVELMIEKLTHLTVSLRRLKIQMEEYVCLKVIVLLQQAKNQHKELEVIQERYVNCLKTFCQTYFPTQPTRVEELLVKISDIQEAAGLLLASKLFYVPFLMCSKISR